MAHIIENPDSNPDPSKRFTPKPESKDSGKVLKALSENGTTLKKHTIEDVDTVLGVLVLNGGNLSRTSRQVAEEFAIEVHPVTIKNWIEKYFPERYAKIQEKLSDEVGGIVTGRLGILALRGTELQASLLEKLAEEIDRDEPVSIKDLTPSIRNLAQATDLNIKQRQLLEDKPTQIAEIRTIEQAVEELERNDILIDVNVIEEEDI